MKFKNALIIVLLTITPMLGMGPVFLRKELDELILSAKITAGAAVCLGMIGTYLIIKKYFDMKNKIDELEKKEKNIVNRN